VIWADQTLLNPHGTRVSCFIEAFSPDEVEGGGQLLLAVSQEDCWETFRSRSGILRNVFNGFNDVIFIKGYIVEPRLSPAAIWEDFTGFLHGLLGAAEDSTVLC